MPGHVFVTRGDMRRLACDAWSLPCDVGGLVVPSWLTQSDPLAGPAGERYLERIRDSFCEVEFAYRGRGVRRLAAIPERFEGIEDWGDEQRRAARFRDWDPAWGPRPWLVNVGTGRQRSIEWYCKGLLDYVGDAADALGGSAPRYGRARPLIAVHAIGTGLGGTRHRKAEMIFRQLEVMQGFLDDDPRPLDLVFVAFEESAFAAAQACRRRGLGTSADAGQGRELFPELSPEQREQAQELARRALTGNLVAFLGAGVSIPAGLPGWAQLLCDAAAETPELATRLEGLQSLDPLDQASVVERFVPTLRQDVCARLQPPQAALGHTLLASLPVAEFVTQNYDRLFELAAAAAGAPVAVIPGTRVAEEHRWLLKMHGSVDRPEEIVLTREDYLRYGDRRAALSAIVQALLITKHMLFVGFSLSDPNFHRIADDVRKVLHSEGHPFGSVLLLLGDELRETLWRDDLSLIACAPAGGDVAEAARLHDVFLDCLLFEASASAAYLLDEAYAHALSETERELRDALRDLKRFEPELGGTPTWDAVARLLGSLGDTSLRPTAPPPSPAQPPTCPSPEPDA
jgi:SIR2-like protein